jgi:hypothetical protein
MEEMTIQPLLPVQEVTIMWGAAFTPSVCLNCMFLKNEKNLQ